jgi:hypothetical protein
MATKITYVMVVEVPETISKVRTKSIETDLRIAKSNIEEWADDYNGLDVRLTKRESLKGIS